MFILFGWIQDTSGYGLERTNLGLNQMFMDHGIAKSQAYMTPSTA